MNIYRNIDNGRLYYIYKVSPPMYTGHWFETEDMITKEVRKMNQSSWKWADFIPYVLEEKRNDRKYY